MKFQSSYIRISYQRVPDSILTQRRDGELALRNRQVKSCWCWVLVLARSRRVRRATYARQRCANRVVSATQRTPLTSSPPMVFSAFKKLRVMLIYLVWQGLSQQGHCLFLRRSSLTKHVRQQVLPQGKLTGSHSSRLHTRHRKRSFILTLDGGVCRTSWSWSWSMASIPIATTILARFRPSRT